VKKIFFILSILFCMFFFNTANAGINKQVVK